ncbi:MAG TPA: tetratricopeptide repeat protein [Myxococcaceae bacterium]|nr:tetratricopeptide repeat protein [Myxococcaceae bacterium]
MDVRCERCGTSYALDESRLGEGGARVRCARCGHVFLIQRTGSPPPPPPAGAPLRREWKVRGRDGSVSSFRELTTLQRWIVERKLGRDDEIGLDGENWKRLGSIPDLAPFFEVVVAAGRARELEAELARARAAPVPAAGVDLSSAVTAVLEPPVAPEAAEAPPAVRAEAARPPAPPPATSTSTGAAVPPQRRRTAPAMPALGEPAFTRTRSALGLPTSDDWEPPRLKRGAAPRVLLLLLALAAVGGALYWAYVGIYLPEEARAREVRARAARAEQEQREQDERQRAAEQRAKQELLQALSASVPDGGAAAGADGGQPRGSLETRPPPAAQAPPADTPLPARALQTGDASAAGPPDGGAGGPALASVGPERRGPPQTFEEWMAEGHRRRTHERAAGALAAYDRALALAPGRAEAHTGRGLALLDLGRRTEALAEFQRALELDPRDGIAVLGMAETYRSLGRTEEARRAYQRYLDGWPGGSESRAARAALESLKE